MIFYNLPYFLVKHRTSKASREAAVAVRIFYGFVEGLPLALTKSKLREVLQKLKNERRLQTLRLKVDSQ
jgi:hypothetical protein